MAALAVVFQGSGQISIPIERYIWPEQRHKRKPFTLHGFRLRFTHFLESERIPWADRARSESYWRCRSCSIKGDEDVWRPWPVPVKFCGELLVRDGEPVVNDEVWEWWNSLHPDCRDAIVEDSRQLARFERELATSRRAPQYGRHGMREMVPNCR